MADTDPTPPPEPEEHSCPHCEEIKELRGGLKEVVENVATIAGQGIETIFDSLGDLLGVGADAD